MATHTVVQPIQAIFESMTMKELQRTRKFLNNIIKVRTPSDRDLIASLDINDFVDFKEDFLTEDNLLAINKDFNAANYVYLQGDNNKTKSLWLSKTNESYQWTSEVSGKTTTNQAIPISLYKNIEKLLDRINDSLGCDLNSCLIQFYPNGESGIRLHDDFEETMDPGQPIVVVSSGATREVQFLHNYQTSSEAPIKVINASSGSLYVMKAKCQEYFRHRVPSNKSCKQSRFSLSFRQIIMPPNYELIPKPLLIPDIQPAPHDSTIHIPIKSPVKPSISYFENLSHTNQDSRAPQHVIENTVIKNNVLKSVVPKNTAPQKPLTQSKDIVLLFGTSMTRWVDSALLSTPNIEFINCSKRGAYIRDFPAMVDDFIQTNPERISHVSQIIFSVGTNDIKLHRQNIGRFKKSLCQLIAKARKSFGEDVSIHFQSVLPMRNLYTYTIDNFLGFNKLLMEVCRELYCYYFDCFNEFLDYEHYDHNTYLFSDHIHLNRRGYAVLHNCLKSIINVDRNIIFAPEYSCYY